MQEPAVSSVLVAEAGGTGKAGNKVRALSAEEIKMAALVEESVQRVLMEKQTGQAAPPVTIPSNVRLPGTIQFKTPSSAAPPTAVTPSSAVKLSDVSHNTQTNPTTESVQKLKPSSVVAPAGKLQSQSTAQPSTSTLSKSSAPTSTLKRKLPKHELETVGKALELTVKHRYLVYFANFCPHSVVTCFEL